MADPLALSCTLDFHAYRGVSIWAGLCDKDRKVLQLLCTGMTDAEIGRAMATDEHEIRAAVAALSAGAGCSTRAELLTRAALEPA